MALIFPPPIVPDALAHGTRVRIDPHVEFFADGRLLVGGSPRRLSRVRPQAQDVVTRLRRAGAEGVVLESVTDRAIGRIFIDRGIVHPVVASETGAVAVDIVIPTRDRLEQVDRLLRSLARPGVVVVDDESVDEAGLAEVVTSSHGRVVRHARNAGPAAARNTGIAATSAPFVAFIDSDCIASPDWPDTLMGHFDDPRVAMVASRIVHESDGSGLVDQFESFTCALDAGPDPAAVGPSSPCVSVPSTAIVVRRAALEDGGFDEEIRVGEDIDLVWRLVEAGWLVRHEPSSVVRHDSITDYLAWMLRHFEYGTFAGRFDARHPELFGRPLAWWSAAVAGTLVSGHPGVAASICGARLAHRWWSIRDLPDAGAIAFSITKNELSYELQGLSAMVRSHGWPVGAAILLCTPWSPAARRAGIVIIGPVVWEWASRRPAIGLVPFVVLRLSKDVAEGTGVIVSFARRGSVRPLLPKVRFPRIRVPRRPSTKSFLRRRQGHPAGPSRG